MESGVGIKRNNLLSMTYQIYKDYFETQEIVRPKRKILLMILETPIALPHWLLRIKWLFTKVIVHTDKEAEIIHEYECDTTIYPGIHDSFDSESTK